MDRILSTYSYGICLFSIVIFLSIILFSFFLSMDIIFTKLVIF